MYKNILSVFAFLVVTCLSLGAYAQETTPPLKIALINVKKVETASVAWKSLSEQIGARRSKLKDEIQLLQSSLEEKAKSLDAQRALLSAEAFAVEVDGFKKERAALDQAARSRKQSLDKAYLEARGQIRKALNAVMLEVVQKENITLVLKAGEAESTVYFAATSMFIDEMVLGLLNLKIQEVILPTDTPSQ